MRILIVEDEKISRQKMQLIMNNFGECDSLERGDKAVEAFQKAWDMRAPYDVITLDIVLEDMNGMDVLLNMREIEKSMNLPAAKKAKIIMVTSQSDRDFVITCMTANCDGYVVKPFTKQTISKCLHKIFLDYVNNILIPEE
jgi:two-component system, chemotaxis family, chemotaxis protein CheY